ncbi:MAG: SUMF1/EgtB/PvdO family nonheme iron enzyme [Planctomycetaceae bacterium]|jgi:formylglycine-generating enzyme required for sulfatase activity/serine/threonine protein kinase|nr:SUMF1/EgtB/PvdO family nonheme iron enzyme [Planctomycetaceae bacterium]
MTPQDKSVQETLFNTTYTELPSDLVMKQQLGETTACETWTVFDRTKKKKFVFKRIKSPFCGDQTVFERFRNDLAAYEQSRLNGIALPSLVLIGQNAEGIWYVRESVNEKSLAELVVAGKSMRDHDAARRFAALTGQINQLHQSGRFHRCLKPTNIFLSGMDDVVVVDPDAGYFLDPAFAPNSYDPSMFGSSEFLAPEQRRKIEMENLKPLDAKTDLWSLAALLGFSLTGKNPSELQLNQIPAPFRNLISSVLKENPAERSMTLSGFLAELERIVNLTRPSNFSSSFSSGAEQQPVSSSSAQKSPTSSQTSSSPADSSAIRNPETSAKTGEPILSCSLTGSLSGVLPPDTDCPQCHTPVHSAADRHCPQCGRPYQEPCLNCQSTNPFWIRTCRGCGSDLVALKQKMLATLNSQKQQILKFRETYGHDRTLPLLKYMSTVNHPDFNAFKEWAKSMTALIQKERRDIKAYVDNIRMQTHAAMMEQKYDKVQQILEQVPRPLLDEPLRKQYAEAGEILTEVDSLIREIRNAISTKRYSQLLSCVQRYLELKANDPEAKNLQQKIEKLTTITTPKGMKLRRIPNGRFYMGSHDSDEYLRNNEHPQHRVQITRNLFVGVYPVTQGEFSQLMGFNPSITADKEGCPVDSVTWYSAVEYCNKMSELEELSPFYELKAVKRRTTGTIEKAEIVVLGGTGYRLLTEAEWEYTCRAGSITPWCYGDQVMEVGDYAWHYDNSSMETHPVGEKKPNSWGLFDMHGNVMEWCHDWYGEFYYQQCSEDEENPTGPQEGMAKVLRGGAWQFGAEATRCAYRNSSSPDTSSGVIGFRICRNAPDDSM